MKRQQAGVTKWGEKTVWGKPVWVFIVLLRWPRGHITFPSRDIFIFFALIPKYCIDTNISLKGSSQKLTFAARMFLEELLLVHEKPQWYCALTKELRQTLFFETNCTVDLQRTDTKHFSIDHWIREVLSSRFPSSTIIGVQSCLNVIEGMDL